METQRKHCQGYSERSHAAAEGHGKGSHSQQHEGQQGLLGRSRAAAQPEQEQPGKGHEGPLLAEEQPKTWVEIIGKTPPAGSEGNSGNDSANKEGYARAASAPSPTNRRRKSVAVNSRLSGAIGCRAVLIAACLCLLYAVVTACLSLWPLALAVAYAAWQRARRWRGSGGTWHRPAGRPPTIGGLRLARGRRPHPGPGRQRPAAYPPGGLKSLFTAPAERSESACRLFLAALGVRRWAAESIIRLPDSTIW